jgi:hypothetical protein
LWQQAAPGVLEQDLERRQYGSIPSNLKNADNEVENKSDELKPHAKYKRLDFRPSPYIGWCTLHVDALKCEHLLRLKPYAQYCTSKKHESAKSF